MPPINTNRILGSTSIIGSSTLWWISYYSRPSKPIYNRPDSDPSPIVHDEPFSSTSIRLVLMGGIFFI